MTPLGKTLRHLYATSGHTSLTEWCQCVGVSYGTIRHWIRTETEPTWLRTLRTIKRRTGLTWGELLDGHSWERRAVRVAEPRDWREDWCCPECYAAHDQKEPCGDCPARRAAHK